MTDFQFRLWISLITYVDDYGRGDARPAVIKGACFPLRDRVTNKDIEAALSTLADIGCVGLYTVDGKPYLYLPNWESHQRVRQKVSKYPAPDDSNSRQSAATCGNVRLESESNPESRIQNPKEYNARTTRFTPPTVDQVSEYCHERNNRIDAQHFVDFYASKGWKVGNTPMKDWKAAVRNWETRDKNGRTSGGKPNPALAYTQRDYSADEANDVFTDLSELERQLGMT